MVKRSFVNLRKRMFGIIGIACIYLLPLLHTLYKHFQFKKVQDIDYDLMGLLFFIGILGVIFIVLFKTISKVPRSFVGYQLRMIRAIIPMLVLFLVFKYYENFLTSAAAFMLIIMGYVSIGFMCLGVDWLINKKELIYKERLKKAKEIKAIQDIVKQLGGE